MDSIQANRSYWNRTSRGYQERHNPQIGAAPRLWGAFCLPDAVLGDVIGDVGGLRVLELGCGAGQWARALAGEAALVVGLDLSEEQLAAARAAGGGVGWHQVQGAAERLPFAEAAFDLVFCDHGAMSWAPPQLAVPEATRVLRPGGRLVFNTASPWLHACYDEAADRVGDRLRQRYFGLYEVDEEAEDDGARSYVLGYGDWIRVLRGAGLVVEDLVEPRPGPQDRSGYWDFEPPDWPSRWPCEALWVARRPR